MAKTNPQVLQFFMDQYRPGLVGLVGTKDFLGKAIREAEKKITPDGEASKWSHCFILEETQWDRRGVNGARTKSPYMFESDLKVKLFKPQIRNGAQENWIGKWCTEDVEHAAVIDFGLDDDQTASVLATALQLVDVQVLYPIQELLGTWWSIIAGRQWQANPLDDPHAMYCSSFVRYCYQEVGADFMGGSAVHVSNTTPEDLAQAGQRGSMTVFEP